MDLVLAEKPNHVLGRGNAGRSTFGWLLWFIKLEFQKFRTKQ